MAERNPLRDGKGKKGSSSVYDSDDRAKGFTQRGIPEQNPFQSQEGTATEMTKPERESNVQREDKGR